MAAFTNQKLQQEAGNLERQMVSESKFQNYHYNYTFDSQVPIVDTNSNIYQCYWNPVKF